MKCSILFVLLAASVCQATVSNERFQNEWIKFEKQYGKSYRSHVELQKRQQIFLNNLEIIEEHNKLYEQGKKTWEMGVTKFSDWTEEEFLGFARGFGNNGQRNDDQDDDDQHDDDYNPHAPLGIFKADPNRVVPDAMDWREHKVLSPVKDQGGCGSCWSFSAVGALEAHTAIFLNATIEFSEQNLIDCSIQPDYYNGGCRGGFMFDAFAYVRDHGIESEGEYPYEGKDGQCRQKRIVLSIRGHNETDRDDEALRQALGTIGPVSVAIDATSQLMSYKGGILLDETCEIGANHAVLAVGYGSENGHDYWIIKNSWGDDFGEKGYFRLSRSKKNHCFISDNASYPILR